MSAAMNDEKKAQLLEELSENSEFLAEMQGITSKQGIQDLFSRYGLELSHEEVDAFVETTYAALDELDESKLEQVAGGIAWEVGAATVFWWAIKGTAKIAKKCWNAGRKFANWEASR